MNETKLTDEHFEKMFESIPMVSMKMFEELKNINSNYVENKRRDDQG